jgi:hypothetical protein
MLEEEILQILHSRQTRGASKRFEAGIPIAVEANISR